jgi:hypothetical protein
LKKYKDFAGSGVDLSFSLMNLKGITLEMTKHNPTQTFAS